jgi:hypothetical protein
MARQTNEPNPDAAWRSRYSDLPSVEEVLRQQQPRVARRPPRVNPAERPPAPPKSTSKSDDEPPNDGKPKAKAGSPKAKAGSPKAKAGSRKAGRPKAEADSR